MYEYALIRRAEGWDDQPEVAGAGMTARTGVAVGRAKNTKANDVSLGLSVGATFTMPAAGAGGGASQTQRGDAKLRARTRILDAATAQFRQFGFDRTSLAEVGAAVGVTRGAVLYHFSSKAQLLAVLLEPFTTGLDAHLAELEAAQPVDAGHVIDLVLDLLLRTRLAADLLARDIAAQHALALDQWFTTSATRLVRLLAPASVTDPAAEARGYAALGATIRPLVHLPDPIDDRVRAAIRDAAAAALGAEGAPRTSRERR